MAKKFLNHQGLDTLLKRLKLKAATVDDVEEQLGNNTRTYITDVDYSQVSENVIFDGTVVTSTDEVSYNGVALHNLHHFKIDDTILSPFVKEYIVEIDGNSDVLPVLSEVTVGSLQMWGDVGLFSGPYTTFAIWVVWGGEALVTGNLVTGNRDYFGEQGSEHHLKISYNVFDLSIDYKEGEQ